MSTIVEPITPLPTVAVLPGIRFRHYRGIELDIPGMAAANQASRTADGEIEPNGFRVVSSSTDWRKRLLLDGDPVLPRAPARAAASVVPPEAAR